jgi:soluble lytic murein transglycosylase-like protein
MIVGNYFLLGRKIRILNQYYPLETQEWHQRFSGSIQWRMTQEGLETPEGIERTRGKPITVGRIEDAFFDEINEAVYAFGVPKELIIACIATESGGHSTAWRTEPGYVSVEETPHRVSVGLMQPLVSTAQNMMRDENVTAEWLRDPQNNIMTGTAYIAHQRKRTLFDPPVVAAAYNAGGVYWQRGEDNRWKMRNFPIGTDKHITRFVRFFNDAFSLGV